MSPSGGAAAGSAVSAKLIRDEKSLRVSLGFLAPQFLWAFLAVPLVILLHFIRARKRRTEVSALFLWKQAKELAQRRRRFRPSWLLALQLAFVSLVALALAQPSLTLSGRPDRVLIIDGSASMAARDPDGVRLEKAVQEALTLTEGAGRVGVVRAGLDAVVVQPLTSDRGEVRGALEALSAADRSADIGRALSLALSVAPEAEIHLFTDSEPPPSNRLTLHAVGAADTPALNVGISTFDIGIQQAFVAVTSNHPRPQEMSLELLQGGEPVAQTTLLVPAAGQANVTFPLSDSAGFFEARLLSPTWDALALDDRAFAGKRDLRVVLNAADEALERALSSIPNLRYRVLPNARPDAPGFDAYIFVGTPPTDPAGHALLFAPPSDEPEFKTVRTWDRSAPLLRFVDLSETRVGLDPAGPSYGDEWEVLARTADLTPVLLRSQGETSDLIAATFHPSQTDMVNRSAFPLLLTNIMNSFRDEERLVLGEPLPAGASLVGVDGDVSRAAATEPGLYRVAEQTYAASLLSAAESRLSFYEPPETDAALAPGVSERVRRAALWLVALALVLLLTEWLLWSRGRWGFARRSRG